MPELSSLLDGISRQSELEGKQGEGGAAEEEIIKAFLSSSLPPAVLEPHCYTTRPFDPRVPRTFTYALKFQMVCSDRSGVLDIGETSNLEVRRKTLKYACTTINMGF